MKDYISEAKAMAENAECGMSIYDAFEQYHNQLKEKISVYKSRYKFNKNQNIGSEIICPACNKTHIKKSYQSQFCSNRGKGNCKDKYNNLINNNRRNRAHHINGNKGALYFETIDKIEIWEDEYYRGAEF